MLVLPLFIITIVSTKVAEHLNGVAAREFEAAVQRSILGALSDVAIVLPAVLFAGALVCLVNRGARD